MGEEESPAVVIATITGRHSGGEWLGQWTKAVALLKLWSLSEPEAGE
jgi:hypothetical protein